MKKVVTASNTVNDKDLYDLKKALQRAYDVMGSMDESTYAVVEGIDGKLYDSIGDFLVDLGHTKLS